LGGGKNTENRQRFRLKKAKVVGVLGRKRGGGVCFGKLGGKWKKKPPPLSGREGVGVGAGLFFGVG